ncbi:MAG: 4Fe-4S binding protein [Candidatus Bruticola sp.]
MLRKIRFILAAIILIVFCIMFAGVGRLAVYSAYLAKIQLIPAILSLSLITVALWIAVAALGGRLYCSLICPLGLLQEVFALIGDKFRMQPKFTYSQSYPRRRYVVLIIFTLCLFTGLGALFTWLDPYALFGRMAANASMLIKNAHIWLNFKMGAIAPRAAKYYSIDWLNFSLTFVIFILIMGAAVLKGRWYCNNICPVGTALGLISSHSLYKIDIDKTSCVKCGLCARSCQVECIDIKSGEVDNSRCVKCFNCLSLCHKNAIAWRIPSKGNALDNSQENISNLSK